MNPILMAVILVSGIGLLLGIVLAVCSAVFAVPVDEKQEKIRECLPGANCGACGFSGCDGYASALSKGETKECTRCTPGGNETAKEIAEIMGIEAGKVTPQAAFVMCRGNCENCDTKLEYHGAQSCKTAAQLFGGPKYCTYGCLGFGDCVHECDYGAISVTDGLARVSPSLCRACKKCVKACPHGLIDMVELHTVKAVVMCKNHDKGAVTRKSCSAGCIGCMKCVKTCPEGAISIDRFCAVVDPKKCVGCGKCAEGCPTKAIELICTSSM